MTRGRKKSTFITQESVPDDHFIDTFGSGVNRKIPKLKLFKQIRDEAQTFIYPTAEKLQQANLEADPDNPIYVRVAENKFRLYQITSLEAGPNDIELGNGATATFQQERIPDADEIPADGDDGNVQSGLNRRVISLPDITALSSLNPAALVDGQQFRRKEFWPGTGVGGVDLYWDVSRPVSEHNGGTIIDPAKISELDTTTKTFGTYFTPYTGSGNTGCFVVPGVGADSPYKTAMFGGDYSAPILSAGGLGVEVEYPQSGDHPNDAHPFQPSIFQDALWKKVRIGSSSEPVSDHNPGLWVHKYSSARRDEFPGAYDIGAIMGVIRKVDGDAYTQAIHGQGYHIGGTGDVVGVHGRGSGRHKDAKVWGGWFYADMLPGGEEPYGTDCIGVEVNLRNQGSDVQFDPPPGVGEYRGVVVLTADGSAAANTGVDIGRQEGGGAKGWMTGLRLRRNGIVPSNEVGEDTCQIRVEGATTAPDRYGGVSFEGNYFSYLIDMTGVVHPPTGQAAISMAYGHRLRWGSRVSSRYLVVESSAPDILNFENYNIAINGDKVLGTRRTGWVAPDGVASRDTFDTSTVTVAQLAERVKALIDDLTFHGLIGE